MQKSTCFFVCTGSFVQGSGAWGAGRRSRFVYAARGRTFRRLAAGTLRGSRPAGVPSGTQCAPASRFPAAMNLHGPAHEAPVYTWAHATQNSRISVGKQMLGYGEKRLCAAHAVSGRGSMLFALNTKPDGKGACTGTKAGRRLCPGCRSMKQKHLGAGQIPVS